MKIEIDGTAVTISVPVSAPPDWLDLIITTGDDGRTWVLSILSQAIADAVEAGVYRRDDGQHVLEATIDVNQLLVQETQGAWSTRRDTAR